MGTDYYTSLYGNLHTKLPKSISSAFRLPESNSTFASWSYLYVLGQVTKLLQASVALCIN